MKEEIGMRFWEKEPLWQMQADYLEEEERLGQKDGMESWGYSLFSPAKAKEIKDFEAFAARPMPPSMRHFYARTGGINVEFCWRKGTNATWIIGQGQIMSPRNFVRQFNAPRTKKGERLRGDLWDEQDDPAYVKDLEDRYFILDRLGIHHYTFTLFRFAAGKDEPELYLFKYPCHLYPLTLSFADYMDLAHEVKMLCTWQDCFIDRERCAPAALAQLEQERPYPFFTALQEVWPQADLSRFPEAAQQKQETPLSYLRLAQAKDYARRFQESRQQLESRLNAVGGSCAELPVPEHLPDIHTIRKIETILGRRLPDSMLAFYSQLNGFGLDWKYKKLPAPGGHDYTPGGYFKVLPLDMVFGGFEDFYKRRWHDQVHEGIVTMTGVQTEEQLALAKQCRLICSEPFNDTVIRFVEGREEPELYVIVHGKFKRLTLDFAGFLERLLEIMGLEYWQRFFIPNEDRPPEDFAYLPTMRAAIAEIFPAADLSMYRSDLKR